MYTTSVFLVLWWVCCHTGAENIHLVDYNAHNICYKVCKNESSSYLQSHCTESELILETRHCCKNISHHSQIIGIDLRGCNLSDIRNSISSFNNSLIIISLEDNPIKTTSDSDFLGFTRLKYLSLPPLLGCPGGSKAWKSIKTTNISTICLDQTDLCFQNQIKCPLNSICINTGPGLYECDCLSGYHGYKCLRKGIFPMTLFSIGIVSSTAVISLVLWIIQRRHVKKIS